MHPSLSDCNMQVWLQTKHCLLKVFSMRETKPFVIDNTLNTIVGSWINLVRIPLGSRVGVGQRVESSVILHIWSLFIDL